ncbi:DUF3800 domain-containing protein [Porphyrobacter sp. AAP60]|uniref:DUF3800 domain-containing protein n=1 Tax=Porphyrobacter sp. AAP60 TaxID=1523423 RepID=UPI000A6435A9|nr:DUF3800 domain-containing protein [Porphyrobacter sp. AAP60]
MIVCYLDDSDAKVSKVETIAGYLADEEGWSRFEEKSEEICSKYDVELIRGHDLDNRRKAFRGWTQLKCQRFLEEISIAMVGNVIGGISRSIGKDHYKLRKRQLMETSPSQKRSFASLSGFGFCFGNISVALKDGDEFGIRDQVREEGIIFNLEAGSSNNLDIVRYVEGEKDHRNLHINTIVSEVDKRSCRAIQIADLYAFYSRRRGNYHERRKHLIIPRVPDIHQLHFGKKVPHDTAVIEEPFISGTNQRTGETFSFMGLTKGLHD